MGFALNQHNSNVHTAASNMVHNGLRKDEVEKRAVTARDEVSIV